MICARGSGEAIARVIAMRMIVGARVDLHRCMKEFFARSIRVMR